MLAEMRRWAGHSHGGWTVQTMLVLSSEPIGYDHSLYGAWVRTGASFVLM
jgi:hypothetical protein